MSVLERSVGHYVREPNRAPTVLFRRSIQLAAAVIALALPTGVAPPARAQQMHAAPTTDGDADERARPPTEANVITEVELKRLSDAVYSWLLDQAIQKGHFYSPEVIASGYKRHFEELKVQLIGQGYIILVGEAGT